MLGYTYEDFLGKKLWEIGLFKDVVLSKVAFTELQDRKYIRYEDLPLETKDGRPMEVEFVSNVYSVNGSKIIQCNVRDITDRKKSERLVSAERDRLQQYLDIAAGIVVVLDRDGNIKLLNKRGCTILGCMGEDLVLGKNWFDMFIPDRIRLEIKKVHTDIIEDKLKDEGAIIERENAVLTMHGEERIIKWRNTVLRDENGNPYNTLSYGADITAQRELEKERNAHWDKLEKKLKENLDKLKTSDHSNGYHIGLSKAKRELDKAMSAMSIDLSTSNSNFKVVK
jgi:PAS domain S-box-containing protein